MKGEIHFFIRTAEIRLSQAVQGEESAEVAAKSVARKRVTKTKNGSPLIQEGRATFLLNLQLSNRKRSESN